jgi:hypothetical protein
VDSSTVYETWRNTQLGYGGEYRSEQAYTSTDQWGYMYGYMPAPIRGPVALRVGMSTGGRVVDSAEWSFDAGSDPYGGGCTDRWSGRTMFWLCTGGGVVWGYTYFSYSYMAGSVTYHSQGYSRTWDDLTGTEYVYHWNDAYAYDNTVPLGDDWSFDVRLGTADGEHDLSRRVQLARSEPWGWSQPYECFSWEYPDWGYSSTLCSGWSYRQEVISGYDEG